MLRDKVFVVVAARKINCLVMACDGNTPLVMGFALFGIHEDCQNMNAMKHR